MAFGAQFAGNFGLPKYLSASGVVAAKPCLLIGFLCTATGTISLDDNPSAASADNRFLPSFSVTAGQFVPLALSTQTGCYATLLGGAAGTFIVGPDV